MHSTTLRLRFRHPASQSMSCWSASRSSIEKVHHKSASSLPMLPFAHTVKPAQYHKLEINGFFRVPTLLNEKIPVVLQPNLRILQVFSVTVCTDQMHLVSNSYTHTHTRWTESSGLTSSVRLAMGKQTNARGAWSAADRQTQTQTHTHTTV